MERRNFVLQALFACCCPLLDWLRKLFGRTTPPILADTRGRIPGWSKQPDWKNDRLMCVMGGSLANMADGPPGSDYILALRGGRSPAVGRVPAEKGIQWFESMRGGWPEGYYPRGKSFSVVHELLIGTVDEIVADFRAGLERAAYCALHGYDDAKLTQISPVWNEERYWASQAELQKQYELNCVDKHHAYVCTAAHLPIPYNVEELDRFDREKAARDNPVG